MKHHPLNNDLDLKPAKRRSVLTLSILFLGFTILISRAYILQTESDQKIHHLAERQYHKVLSEVPDRGNIYDIRGRELAVSLPTYSLVAYPYLVKNPKEEAQTLSRLIDVPFKVLYAKLKSGKKFAWIKRNLSQNEEEKLKSLRKEKDWLDWVREGRRFYPHREMASQLLGAVGYDNKGLGGLELYHEKYLRSDQDRSIATQDARGLIYQTAEAAIQGDNVSHVYLTIDRDIQHAAELELARGCEKFQAKGGTAIVMNPHTGAILAMANFPPFNPNSYKDYPLSSWKNQAVTDTFEPGSTFKVIAAAGALEHKAVTLEDRFNAGHGEYQVSAGHAIHDDHDNYGILNLRGVLQVSSNIGAYLVEQKLGKKEFYNTIRDFGFGEKTNVDFLGEASGLLRSYKKWGKLDEATISFGQGVSATSLQMTNAYATIANGGWRVTPYLTDHIVDETGQKIFETQAKKGAKVISEETAATLRELLTSVVGEGGTGIAAEIPGYSIAGKTGTAQKIDRQTGLYSSSKYVASFVGIVPATQPELVIFVMVDEPQGSIYAASVAAPIFKKIAGAALHYRVIPPDQNPPSLMMTLPKSFSKISSETIDGRHMPQLTGLSLRRVKELATRLECHLNITGTGRVVSQSPATGSSLHSGDRCEVILKTKS